MENIARSFNKHRKTFYTMYLKSPFFRRGRVSRPAVTNTIQKSGMCYIHFNNLNTKNLPKENFYDRKRNSKENERLF